MAERILIVEDEAKIARVIQLELEHEGYTVEIARDGRKGLDKVKQNHHDLVLLDIRLPELNGLEVLRRIRKSGNTLPVILLTARNSTPDKVSGLDQGADDYISKPFEIEELLARIRACLRTHDKFTEDNHDVLQIEDLTVNRKTREVIRKGHAIELTPREFDLLIYLMGNAKQVLTREQILTNVWGFDYFGDTNVVDVYIRYLRKKIDQGFDMPLIHTVRGVGYTLKGKQ
ncbi:response regulator transcription factor [Lentibacillus sp. L22]|uniref:response regulator transcription factor n=1 Tax=Lentibacillus sp. L22 TaxID=3163028 RepID=UPI003465BE48